MTYAAMIALIPLFGLLHRLRGDDFGKPWTSDGAVAFVEGAIIGGLALWHGVGWQHSGGIGLTVWAGMWIWAAPAWGIGFAAIHGRWASNGILSRAVEHLATDSTTRGILYMSARGFLGLVPLAAGLALWGHPLAGAALATAGALQGVVYWTGGIHQRRTGRDSGVPFSELGMGALIGVVVGLI